MSKKTIEQELTKITGIKPGKDRGKFLISLANAAVKLSDEDWDKLSDPAGKWANAAYKAVEAKTEVADFPDAKTDEVKTEEEAPVAEKKTPTKTADKKPAPAPKAKSEAAKPAPDAKKEIAPKAEKKVPVKKGPGKIEKMKGIMLKNLKVKPDDLKAKLGAAGIEISDATITTVRSDFLSSIRVLQKAGLLTKDLVDAD